MRFLVKTLVDDDISDLWFVVFFSRYDNRKVYYHFLLFCHVFVVQKNGWYGKFGQERCIIHFQSTGL